MASSLPIPAPPRTPTPPTPLPGDEEDTHAFGGRTVLSTITFDPNSLSPLTDTFPGSAHFGSMNSSMDSPAFSDASLGPPPSAGGRNPFNFQTQTIKDTPVIAKSVCQTEFTCIPSINVPTSPSSAMQENSRNDGQSPPYRPPREDKSMGASLDPLLSEQAGNTFGRARARQRALELGLGISTNYADIPTSFLITPHSPTGYRQANDKSTVRARKQVYSNLTPPTPAYPYTFLKINPKTQNIGQRRGHRYKHSSVSTQHQIFLEPPPRAPLTVPNSLDIPTYKEIWERIDGRQKGRLAWCMCHILISGVILYFASDSLAMTALSHLVFFDALSATICVVVEIIHSFEVWRTSTVRHPFGLQRAEVLGGFAMSILLLFMGFDLVSHNLKHVLESLGSHTPHHPHSHERITAGKLDVIAALAAATTLVSALSLKNHEQMGKLMRFKFLDFLYPTFTIPSVLLTLSSSGALILLSFFDVKSYLWLDRLFCTIIAVSMFTLGVHLAIKQGLMLLMSFSGNGVSDVVREISLEPLVTGIGEAKFWQVHYGLCIASLRLRVKGVGKGPQEEEQILKLRNRIALLVRQRLGGGYGKGEGLKWEVTIQFDRDGRE